MKVLHITPNTNGYEVVELVANRVSKQNSLSVIRVDSKEYMTGGFIINDTEDIRAVLDSLQPSKVYQFVKSFIIKPICDHLYLEIDDMCSRCQHNGNQMLYPSNCTGCGDTEYKNYEPNIC